MIGYLDDASKTMPHLDCIYGLMARCYMWLEDYPNAEKYARLAIDNSTSAPVTQAQALNTTSGFKRPEPVDVGYTVLHRLR